MSAKQRLKYQRNFWKQLHRPLFGGYLQRGGYFQSDLEYPNAERALEQIVTKDPQRGRVGHPSSKQFAEPRKAVRFTNVDQPIDDEVLKIDGTKSLELRDNYLDE